MAVWIALVTLDQLRSAECKVACGYTGYDGGIFWKENCYCFDIKEYYELTNRKRIILPKKSKGALPLSSYTPPKEESVTPSWHYRGYPKEEEFEIP